MPEFKKIWIYVFLQDKQVTKTEKGVFKGLIMWPARDRSTVGKCFVFFIAAFITIIVLKLNVLLCCALMVRMEKRMIGKQKMDEGIP